MPLWPVPPLIALTGVVIALTKQTQRDLFIVGGMFLFGIVYYALFLRRGDRYASRDLAAEELGVGQTPA
jgi:hypothetical protein